jgi:hypothetical protein
MGKERHLYSSLPGILVEKRPVGKSRYAWVVIIKMEVVEIG